jgi:hypothetical protein
VAVAGEAEAVGVADAAVTAVVEVSAASAEGVLVAAGLQEIGRMLSKTRRDLA